MSTSITSRQAPWDIDDEPFHALGRPQEEAMTASGRHETAKGNNTAYFAAPYVPSNWPSVSERLIHKSGSVTSFCQYQVNSRFSAVSFGVNPPEIGENRPDFGMSPTYGSDSESDLSAAMDYLNRIFSPDRTKQVEPSMESQFVDFRDQTNTTHFHPAIEYIAEIVKGRRTVPYIPVDMFAIARSPANQVIRCFADDVWVGVSDPASTPSPRRLTFVNESQFFPIEDPMDERLDHIFWEAQWEQFETGMDSKLSENLQQLYRIDPYTVLQSLIDRTTGDEARPEVLAEMLTWISRQEAFAGLRLSIVDLLSRGVLNSSALVRDAAALGLAYFDGNIAKDYIKQAIKNEHVPELRRDLQDLVRSLETHPS